MSAPETTPDQGNRLSISEQRLMDRVWRAVDALGAPDTACTAAEDFAYCRAISDALAEIEKLGGRYS